MAEGFAEIPGGDAGHAHGGHGLDFVKTQFEKLGVGDGIDIGVVGAGAVPGYQKGHAFVKIMDHRGMPFVKHAVNGFGGFVSLLVSVAIDVHESILGPVRGRHARESGAIGFAFQIFVKPFDDFVAAIGIGHGIDQHDQIFRECAESSAFRSGEAVGEFQHRFGGAGFIGMQTRH